MARLLAVDDDPDFCESLRRYFSALGHQVTCEKDGREGLKALLRDDPDLILLDLRMPVMSGVDFLKVARSYVRFRSHPVLVMTGIDDDEVLSEVQGYGVVQIFIKGNFEFADVRRAIEQATYH